MIPWRRLDRALLPAAPASRASTAAAPELSLWQRGDELALRLGGIELMNSRQHHSEDELGRLACMHLGKGDVARVLIGGLGMGFTLRAVLDAVGPRAEVEVAELCTAVVRWNREHLGALAAHPLRDRRVHVFEGDVRQRLGRGPGYDAILLDVDNGPEALSAKANAQLYDREGLAVLAASLRPGGTLAVWAVADDLAFSKRLRSAGFYARRHHVRARPGAGATHVITLARLEPWRDERGERDERDVHGDRGARGDRRASAAPSADRPRPGRGARAPRRPR
jgi:spermidine synthase